MKLNEAVAARILEYCNNRNITVNKLCTMSGVYSPPSTAFSREEVKIRNCKPSRIFAKDCQFLFRSFSTAPCFQISTISCILLTFPPPWDYNFPEVIL